MVTVRIMIRIVTALALFAAAASAQLDETPQQSHLRLESEDSVATDATGSEVGSTVPINLLARLSPTQMAETKSYFISKPFGAITGQSRFLRSVGACGAGMRLAALETAAQVTSVLSNIKDVVNVDRLFWVANTRLGGADTNDYYLINKGTSVTMTTIFPTWAAPTPNQLGTNDCVQVKVTGAIQNAAASATLVFANCASSAFVLCEMDWASTNPLFDRVV